MSATAVSDQYSANAFAVSCVGSQSSRVCRDLKR